MATYELMIDNAKMQVHCHVEPPPAPIVVDVPLTEGHLIQYDTDGTNTNVAMSLPVTFKNVLYPSPTNDHSESTYFYASKWDGIAASTLDFVPETPDGYALTSVRFIMKAHTTGGSQSDIGEDTSGWGYRPPPTKTPWINYQHSGGESFIEIPPTTDPTNPIESGELNSSLFMSEGIYADPFVFMHQYVGSPTPPYTEDPVQIVVSYLGIRFTFTAIS